MVDLQQTRDSSKEESRCQLCHNICQHSDVVLVLEHYIERSCITPRTRDTRIEDLIRKRQAEDPNVNWLPRQDAFILKGSALRQQRDSNLQFLTFRPVVDTMSYQGNFVAKYYAPEEKLTCIGKACKMPYFFADDLISLVQIGKLFL